MHKGLRCRHCNDLVSHRSDMLNVYQSEYLQQLREHYLRSKLEKLMCIEEEW